MSVTSFHEATDEVMTRLADMTAEQGRPVTCRAGCFHCCLEPMYADLTEAQAIMAAIPDEKRPGVYARTRAWVARFEEHGLHAIGSKPSPNDYGALLKYRAARLPCPLVEDGRCIAYAHRPFGCRTHSAIGSPSRCADDAQRPKQTFLKTDPRMIVALTGSLVEGMPFALLQFDHLGVWLAEIQRIQAPRTKARHNCTLQLEA
jgi:hypothetical protein